MYLIFQILFIVIRIGTNLFLAPVNLVVSTMFPDFGNMVSTFNNFLNTYISPALLFFFEILPTNTRTLLIFYIELRIIIYLGSISIHGIIKVIEIIKAIKIW